MALLLVAAAESAATGGRRLKAVALTVEAVTNIGSKRQAQLRSETKVTASTLCRWGRGCGGPAGGAQLLMRAGER